MPPMTSAERSRQPSTTAMISKNFTPGSKTATKRRGNWGKMSAELYTGMITANSKVGVGLVCAPIVVCVIAADGGSVNHRAREGVGARVLTVRYQAVRCGPAKTRQLPLE